MRKYREWLQRLGRRELVLIVIGAVVSAFASAVAARLVEAMP
ncbi:hypothetical protein [Streptomyces venezuelae]|nr:hypothetical protein [Streptomyces venezuelae]